MLRQSFTANAPRADCRERLSEAFVERTYETLERCVAVQKGADGDPAESIEFSRVEVQDDRAVVDLELRGGDPGGAEGSVELVDEGAGWRIDDASVEFLRSLLEASTASQQRAGELPPGARGCLARVTRDIADPAFKEFAYAVIGETEQGKRWFFELFATCDVSDGRSLLRVTFEREVAKDLMARSVGDRAVECILARLRDGIPDRELAGLLAAEDQEPLGQVAAAAARACGSESGSAS